MPAHKDPFKRATKTVRLRPWLKDLDITRLARELEEWSFEAMELERGNQNPSPELSQDIGYSVIRIIQEAMGLKPRTYRKPEKRKKLRR